MHNSFQALWEENSFYVLGIPPSAEPAQIRRAVEQARLEVSMGIRQLAEEEFERLSAVLRNDESVFEMRLFAQWDGDPVLGPWAEQHDAIAAAVLRPTNGMRRSEALGSWIELSRRPGLREALGNFAPPGRTVHDLWGECAVDLLRAGTRAGEAPVEFLNALGRPPVIDPGPLVAEVVEETVSSFAEVEKELRADTGAGARPVASLESSFARAADPALTISQALAANGLLIVTAVKDANARLLTRVMAVANAVSTRLHNAGSFEAADRVLAKALQLPLEPGDRSELLAEQRIVRVVWGRSRCDAGMKAKNFGEALAGVQLVIENTDDEDERTQARFLQPRIEQAKRDAERPVLVKLWDRYKGWVVAAAVALGIGALRTYGSSADGDSVDRTTSGGSTVVVSTSSTNPTTRDPAVGDCISISTGSVAESFNVRVVSCSAAHDARVLAKPLIPDASYPSLTRLGEIAEARCPAAMVTYLHPSREGWNAGDRTILCLDQ